MISITAKERVSTPYPLFPALTPANMPGKILGESDLEPDLLLPLLQAGRQM